MKRNILHPVVAVFMMLHLQCAVAQSLHPDTLVRAFNSHREQALQEKLYLHIDRTFFLTGETLWFRIYQVDATLHRPVNLSKVAYVEILDRNNKAQVQVKVRLNADGGHGSIFIPATMLSGNYVVRAYTQWMKNFSPEFYFHNSITVVNPFIRPEPQKEEVKRTEVEFFPEGGYLVDGLRSKVGFRISNVAGTGVRGIVLSEGSDTVSIFHPLKFALGHFYFTPRAGERYRCMLIDDNGKTTTHALPEVKQQGYVMTLNDSGAGELSIRVRTKGIPPSSSLFLFVHSRQVTVFSETQRLAPDEAVFTIPRHSVPAGITHFTLFDAVLNPVCERLYFIPGSSGLAISVTSDQQKYITRRKVALSITAAADDAEKAASVSVAVYRIDSLGATPTAGIAPYLLLSSDLHGFIESPEYYFSDDADARAAADNLMLTHGWRRFSWADVFKKKIRFAYPPEYRSHFVSGKVLKSDGTPARGVLSYLASPSKLVTLYGSRSDDMGNVYFETEDFWGPRKLVLQTNTKVDSTFRLQLNNPFSGRYASVVMKPFILRSSMHQRLKERSLAMQVQDIYYHETIDKPAMPPKSDSTAFYGVADQVYYLDDFTRFPVMEEVMREYVPGVLVRKRRGGFHFIVIDNVNKGVLPTDPLVLLDGVPVFDVNKIMAFDPLKVKKLDVVMRHHYLGPLVIPGMVSYSTYRGDLAGFELDRRALVIDYEGLQLQREFHVPRYENQRLRNSRLPDQRTLIYWAPDIKTGENGRVEFYTSDVSGQYQVVVEGITPLGQAGTGFHTFEVNRQDY
jgi:hypothetical protein